MFNWYNETGHEYTDVCVMIKILSYNMERRNVWNHKKEATRLFPISTDIE